MHELSVCRGLLRQVNRVAIEQHARSVDLIRLQIGPLSGIDFRLLRQAFPIAAADGIAAEAQLIIESTPVRVHCTECGTDSEAHANRLLCDRCGSWKTQLISGDELLLVSIELTRAEVGAPVPKDELHV